MLLEPQRSPYDLNLHLFGVPIRVHPMFWLFAAIFGWSYFNAFGLAWLVLWVLCTFASVLVHEMGHVLAGVLFGRPGHIILYGMGGLAIGEFHLARRWQRIVINLAGPIAGFLLLAVVVGADYVFRKYLLLHVDPQGNIPFLHRGYGLGREPGLGTLVGMLVFMNLFWNLMNLIPILPLDGGQVLREVAQGISPWRGQQVAHGLSFTIAAAIAVYALIVTRRADLWFPPFDPTFTAILFGVLAVQNFLIMQSAGQQRRRDEPEW